MNKTIFRLVIFVLLSIIVGQGSAMLFNFNAWMGIGVLILSLLLIVRFYEKIYDFIFKPNKQNNEKLS